MGVPKDETEEQKAIRLAKAKKNASKAREEAMVAKYKDKVLAKEKEEKKKQVKDESESEDEDEEAPKKPLKPVKEPKPIKEEEEVKEEEKPKPKIKAKTKAKAKVIIEQDSSDDEVFEASKDVIFVKRVRAKPKVEQQHVTQSVTPMPSGTAPVTRQEQPLPNRLQQQQQQQQAPPPKPIKEEEVKEEEEKPKPKTKPKTKPKAKVIIEQDSSDDEVFEASKDVIFVKRVRAKKIEQQHAPQSEAPMPSGTAPVTRQEQPLPQRFQQQQAPPPKPPMSQEKRLEMERYLNMTRGIFLPMSRPR